MGHQLFKAIFVIGLLFFLPFFSFSQSIVNIQKRGSSVDDQLEFYRNRIDELIKKDFSEAIIISNEAIRFAKKSNHKKYEADFLRLKGNAFYMYSAFDSAATYYYKSLKILELGDFPQINAELYNNLGRLYRKLHELDRSLNYYDKAFAVYRKLNDEAGLAVIYNESGVVLEYQGKFDQAIDHYKKSLEIVEKRKDFVGQGYALEFIGGAMIKKKDYGEAEKYLKKSLDIREKTKDDFTISLTLNVLGHFYQEIKNFQKAEQHYQESNKTAIKLGYLDLMRDNYKQLSDIYRKTGKIDSAFLFLQRFQRVNDSIFNLGKLRQVEELSTKYETVQKDKEILLNKNKVLNRNLYIFSLLGLLFFGVIYYRNYGNKQKIKHQKEILYQQDLSAKAVMNAEENERKRMAAQLHDGIGQLLSSANMNINVLYDRNKEDDATSKILVKTKNVLSEALKDVRSLSHEMMPNMLIKNSLSNALRELIENSNSPKLHISLKMEGLDDRIDQNIQVVIYRIIQECINNTIKHAEADHVRISLFQDEHKVKVSITDNGKGFNPAKTDSKNGGLGLENIKSRIKFLQGKMTIKSKEGEGMQIEVEIPLD